MHAIQRVMAATDQTTVSIIPDGLCEKGMLPAVPVAVCHSLISRLCSAALGTGVTMLVLSVPLPVCCVTLPRYKMRDTDVNRKRHYREESRCQGISQQQTKCALNDSRAIAVLEDLVSWGVPVRGE